MKLDYSENKRLTLPNLIESDKGNKLSSKREKKLQRLSEALNGPNGKNLVYVPKKGPDSGVESLAHEIGHGSATGWMRLFRNPARQREYLRKYEKKIRDTIGRDLFPGVKANKSVWTNIKGALAEQLEERRATKEGLRLLKKSGAMSSEEMRSAKEGLSTSYNTYKYYNRGKILESLAQKIQIPSRRMPFGHYKSTYVPNPVRDLRRTPPRFLKFE